MKPYEGTPGILPFLNTEDQAMRCGPVIGDNCYSVSAHMMMDVYIVPWDYC